MVATDIIVVSNRQIAGGNAIRKLVIVQNFVVKVKRVVENDGEMLVKVKCLGANVGCNGYHCCVDATKTQTRTVTSRSRYYVGKDARTADAAQAFCKQAKGNLVTIDDAAENKYVNDLLQKRNIDNAWIGYNDKASEGKFVWFSGATSCYTNWSNKEPNNVNNEDCTHMRKGGTWNDHNCGKQILAFVCEF